VAENKKNGGTNRYLLRQVRDGGGCIERTLLEIYGLTTERNLPKKAGTTEGLTLYPAVKKQPETHEGRFNLPLELPNGGQELPNKK